MKALSFSSYISFWRGLFGFYYFVLRNEATNLANQLGHEDVTSVWDILKLPKKAWDIGLASAGTLQLDRAGHAHGCSTCQVWEARQVLAIQRRIFWANVRPPTTSFADSFKTPSLQNTNIVRVILCIIAVYTSCKTSTCASNSSEESWEMTSSHDFFLMP